MSLEQAKKLVAEQRFFEAHEVLKSVLASGKRAYGIDQVARDVQDRIQRAEALFKIGDELSTKRLIAQARDQFLAAAKLVPDYPELAGRIAATESKLKQTATRLAKAREELAAKRLKPALAAATEAYKIDNGSTVAKEFVEELEDQLADQRQHRKEVSLVVGIVVVAALAVLGAIWYAVAGRDTWEVDRVNTYSDAANIAAGLLTKQRYFEAHAVVEPLIKELDARKKPLEMSALVESAETLRRVESKTVPHIQQVLTFQREAEQATEKKIWDTAAASWDKLLQELDKLPERDSPIVASLRAVAKTGQTRVLAAREAEKKENEAKARQAADERAREQKERAEKERRELALKEAREKEAHQKAILAEKEKLKSSLPKYLTFRDECKKMATRLTEGLNYEQFSNKFGDLLDQYSLIEDKDSELRKDADDVVASLRLVSKTWDLKIKSSGSDSTVTLAMNLSSKSIEKFLKHHEELTQK